MFLLNKITEPTLFIDLDKVTKNITRFIAKANEHNVKLQPHFKTHQSAQIAQIFQQSGIEACTVSSIKMAQYFAQNHWKNIHMAMPILKQQGKEVQELANSINFSVNASCKSHLEICSQIENLAVYIDIDPSYGRTGVAIDNYADVRELIDFANKLKASLKGFYVHNGATYKAHSVNQILDLHHQSLSKLKRLTHEVDFKGSVLFGDTPGCSLATDFRGINTITAGNFVFYDLFQAHLGSCSEDEIAICMVCPVLEKRAKTQSVVIHGGAVHFSKDSMVINGETIFGKQVDIKTSHWKTNPKANFLTSISQEHGILQLDKQTFNQIAVGDVVGILPVHSCLTADSMGKYVSFEGHSIEMMK